MLRAFARIRVYATKGMHHKCARVISSGRSHYMASDSYHQPLEPFRMAGMVKQTASGQLRVDVPGDSAVTEGKAKRRGEGAAQTSASKFRSWWWWAHDVLLTFTNLAVRAVRAGGKKWGGGVAPPTVAAIAHLYSVEVTLCATGTGTGARGVHCLQRLHCVFLIR